MAVKNYGIRDQWTNLDKLNNVDIKSVDGVIESVKINGEEAGGGGSSDLTWILPEQTVTLVDQPVEITGLRLDLITTAYVPLKCIIVDDQTIYATLSVEEGSLHTIDDEYIIYEEDGATYFACSEGQTVIPGEYTISIALF